MLWCHFFLSGSGKHCGDWGTDVTSSKGISWQNNLWSLYIIFSKVDRRPSLLAILSLTGALMLVSLAVPADVQGVLLVVNQALFSGLYYLIDVYVIEVWPTEVHISYIFCKEDIKWRGGLLFVQVRNCGFNMMESVSKAGSAIAPQIVDLGGQVLASWQCSYRNKWWPTLSLCVFIIFFASDKTPN